MTGDGAADGELDGQVLPDDGVVDLADRLTEYMTEIELGGLPDIIGQVLDDFLEQCGGMPDDLRDPRAFEQITNNQLAMTLAYQLGRLAGRSPQIVQRLLQQAAERWKARPVAEGTEVSDADMQRPKELVYPRLRRLEYPESEE
jgi:hypothetical protein